MNVTNIKPAATAAAPKPLPRRMTLDKVQKGKIQAPMRVLLYGIEKCGKSTFAAGAPSPLWMGSEEGTEHLDIARMPKPETWTDVLEGLDEVALNGKSRGYETFVADPLRWFEPMAILDFAKDPGANLATWGGGRGAGYQALADRWRLFQKGVERIRKSGMNVILIAHATVKTFNNPMGPDFERYEVDLDKRAAGMWKQWVDHILFAKQEIFTKTDTNTKTTKAWGGDATMIYTTYTPSFDAGNRACLPKVMPLSWPVFAEALASGELQAGKLREQIEQGLTELADPEVEKKVREYLSNPRVDIAEVASAVAAKVQEKRQAQGATEATQAQAQAQSQD